jgi:protein-tyrosine phosphatase
MREEAAGIWPFDAFLWLPTVDHQPPSVASLRTGIAFLRECERLRMPVLVQCLMGVGRSVTLVLAHMLAGSHRNAGTPAALDLIKARRPEACPTREQVLTAEAAARAYLEGAGA